MRVESDIAYLLIRYNIITWNGYTLICMLVLLHIKYVYLPILRLGIYSLTYED